MFNRFFHKKPKPIEAPEEFRERLKDFDDQLAKIEETMNWMIKKKPSPLDPEERQKVIAAIATTLPISMENPVLSLMLLKEREVIADAILSAVSYGYYLGYQDRQFEGLIKEA